MPRTPPRYYLRCLRDDGSQAAVARSDDLETLRNKARNYPHWELSEFVGRNGGVPTYRLKEESA